MQQFCGIISPFPSALHNGIKPFENTYSIHDTTNYTLALSTDISCQYIENEKFSIFIYGFVSGQIPEQILSLWEKYHHQIANHIDCQCQIFILDKSKQELFIYQDHFATIPLYYYGEYVDRGRFQKFIFGSSIKMLSDAGVPMQINGTNAINFLLFGLPQNPFKSNDSLFTDILSLPGGHYLHILLKENKVRMHNWYRYTPTDCSLEERSYFLDEIQQTEPNQICNLEEDNATILSLNDFKNAMEYIETPIDNYQLISNLYTKSLNDKCILQGQSLLLGYDQRLQTNLDLLELNNLNNKKERFQFFQSKAGFSATKSFQLAWQSNEQFLHTLNEQREKTVENSFFTQQFLDKYAREDTYQLSYPNALSASIYAHWQYGFGKMEHQITNKYLLKNNYKTRSPLSETENLKKLLQIPDNEIQLLQGTFHQMVEYSSAKTDALEQFLLQADVMTCLETIWQDFQSQNIIDTKANIANAQPIVQFRLLTLGIVYQLVKS